MTDDNSRARTDEDGIASLREAVGDELMRAVRAHDSVPWFKRRRWPALAACAVAVAVSGGIAAAQFFPDEPFSQPASPPLFAPGVFASCPASVQQEIIGLESLAEYPNTPGYPVDGCPTLEDLAQRGFDQRMEPLTPPIPPGQDCESMQELSAVACRELDPSGN